MNSPIIQLLVLAGIAVFLILRLKNVLGSRDGYEGPPRSQQGAASQRREGFEVIEGGPDRDITDNVSEDSAAASALADMKRAEPSFGVTDFLQGARSAYEMIIMAFERGNMEEITPLLSEDVFETFSQVVDARQEQGLRIDAEFYGVRETTLLDATFDENENRAEIVVRFVGELTSVVRDSDGNIVEGTPNQPKKQKDTWTFERIMGSDDPNWRLVATGE
ncbi:Tim44/TimA family putative adaptor protein [Roseovarius sp. SYSU LYC5161]|jgi:predicted lipid-binding transport protein (Tim44 family)|uniref:Tim44/TimA family putative adaptor protein n=1 Tax=Roseovarius halophilus (ex Wu et al. 2025) TaxID=3376060 RepID=UPI0028714AED|nr:Tim44/TimA family putative adaptor protein [Roseovarius sp.]